MEENWNEWYEKTPKDEIEKHLLKLERQKNNDETWLKTIGVLSDISDEQRQTVKNRLDIINRNIVLYRNALNVL